MSDGLITRIGKWWDSKFEDKANVAQLEDCRSFCISTHNEFAKSMASLRVIMQGYEENASRLITHKHADGEALNKEITDLKTRIERIEVGTGMYRKIDPTKAPVAKTAFQM